MMQLSKHARLLFAIGALHFTAAPLFAEETAKPAEATENAENKETAPEVKPEDEKQEPDTVESELEAQEQKTARALPIPSDPRQVLGWREYIKVKGLKHPVEAKLDSGARTSSIHAEEQKVFERDGQKWVRFTTYCETEEGKHIHQLEAKLVRTTLIKEPNGESIRRNVVRLNFTIGKHNLRSEFTLNNRSNMNCSVLIGRTALKSLGWVDASRVHIADQLILR